MVLLARIILLFSQYIPPPSASALLLVMVQELTLTLEKLFIKTPPPILSSPVPLAIPRSIRQYFKSVLSCVAAGASMRRPYQPVVALAAVKVIKLPGAPTATRVPLIRNL